MRGAHSLAHCMWLPCNYCRISVRTVLLHYMKDSYLLCPERAFYLSLKLSGIKKKSKAFQYLKDQWPAIVLEITAWFFIFYLCVIFL